MIIVHHIGRDGQPHICTAQDGKCPLGGDEAHHYPSKNACYKAIEDQAKANLVKGNGSLKKAPDHKTEKWTPDDFDSYTYGVHFSDDEKFILASIDAFDSEYGDEYEGSGPEPGDYGAIESCYEYKGSKYKDSVPSIALTISNGKCRIGYSFDGDPDHEAEADIIKLDGDPTKSARMIHDTIEKLSE